MKFFDAILKSIGFEVEESNPQPKEKKKKKQKDNAQKQTSAKFALGQQKVEEKPVEQKPERIVDENSNLSVQAEIGKNIAVFAPVNLDELCGIVDFTRKRLAAIVNLSNLNNSDLDRALEFLGGAMYAMRGQVSQLDTKLYLVAPAGTATITSDDE